MRQWSAIKTLVNAAKTFPMRLVNAVFVNRWTSAGVNRHGVTAALVSGLHCRYAAFTPDTCSPDTSCIHL